MALKAIALNCSLKPSKGESSSTDKMIGLLVSELRKKGVEFTETNGQRNPQDEPPGGLTAAQWSAASTNPVLMHVAHSAGMQMAFHPGGGFGPDVAGDAFVALRGSWNRKPASGYELVRIRFDAQGQAQKIEPFITGFMSREGTSHYGRLAGVAVLPDGSLLFSDDANGVLYRISYDGAQGQAAPLRPPAGPMLQEAAVGSGTPLAPRRPETRASTTQKIQVTATAFQANAAIPRDHSEYGLGISPELAWTAVPNAAAYAIIMEDPDAADPKPVVHWVTWNILAGTTRLPAGLQERDRLSGGGLEGTIQGATSHGTVGWYGPRPPKGDRSHRYHFQVLALDRLLDLPLGATRDQLLAAAAGHILATGELIGMYAEPKP